MTGADWADTPEGACIVILSGVLLYLGMMAKTVWHFEWPLRAYDGVHRATRDDPFPFPLPTGVCTNIKFSLHGGPVNIGQGVKHRGEYDRAYWEDKAALKPFAAAYANGGLIGNAWIDLIPILDNSYVIPKSVLEVLNPNGRNMFATMQGFEPWWDKEDYTEAEWLGTDKDKPWHPYSV